MGIQSRQGAAPSRNTNASPLSTMGELLEALPGSRRTPVQFKPKPRPRPSPPQQKAKDQYKQPTCERTIRGRCLSRIRTPMKIKRRPIPINTLQYKPKPGVRRNRHRPDAQIQKKDEVMPEAPARDDLMEDALAAYQRLSLVEGTDMEDVPANQRSLKTDLEKEDKEDLGYALT